MEREELEGLDENDAKACVHAWKRISKKLREGNLKEHLAKDLYPEIPWKREEIRGLIHPMFIEPWLAIPFYEKPLVVVQTRNKEQFKTHYGLTTDELLELRKKRRVHLLLGQSYKSFYGEQYEHFASIIEMKPPTVRGTFIPWRLASGKNVTKWKEEAKNLDVLISRWDTLFAVLSAAGFRKRVLNGYKKIISIKNEVLRSFYEAAWIGMLCYSLIESPFLDSPLVMKNWIQDAIFQPIGAAPKASQAFVHEVVQGVLEMTDFYAPADPSSVSIDLLVETQDCAKDLRTAYREFIVHVRKFETDEALETRDALEHAADEFRRSTPFLDKVSGGIHCSVSIGSAALTYTALQWLLGPWVSALIAGGELYTTLKREEMREWMEGKYAGLLSKIGLGPFAWSHTWKAQKVVKKAKKRLKGD